jgi:PPOX class probable F420-dependent enzyme
VFRIACGTVGRVNLTEGQARALLAGERVARLATADARGAPHLVPVTFALSDCDGPGLAYIAVDHKPKTTTDLKRLRNIRENPRVCLLADHYEEDWARLWWVRADGSASIRGAGGAPVDLLAAKYPQYRRQRPGGPVIAIEVTRWTGWAGLPAES